MNEKIKITDRVAEHKKRHPNDNNIRKESSGVSYSKKEVSTVDVMMIRKIMKEHNRVIYRDLNLEDNCPECDGKVNWFGSTKHNPNHFRCNKGCIL
tara:strand:- start:979 stop:1266 length:288 start_codon:yes stop_codon:yes gene_type:complete